MRSHILRYVAVLRVLAMTLCACVIVPDQRHYADGVVHGRAATTA
jgi:hypothetical protein